MHCGEFLCVDIVITSFWQLIIAGYLMTGRMYVLMAQILIPNTQLASQHLSYLIWLWLNLVHIHHGSCWPVGYPGSWSCPLHLLFSLLRTSSLQSGSPFFFLQTFGWWGESVSLTGIELVQEVTSGHSAWPKSVLNLYLYSFLVMSWLRWLRPMQKSSGNRASP